MNMRFFLKKIDRLKIDWNERPLTEEDFYRLCKRHKIAVEEMPLTTNGFYYCVLGKHCIAIDSRLKPDKKRFVMFHEFAHYLMHTPDWGVTANFHGVGGRTRKEVEADAFALCALIPRSWIESRTVQEIIDEEGLDADLIRERHALYDLRGL